MSIYVMVSAQIKPGTSAEFERAFEVVRKRVSGTPGHLGEQLLRDQKESDRYTLLGHWESAEKFLAWEDAPVHREMTVPLRPYWAGPVDRVIHEIAVDRVTAEARQ
ncbi:antibiotic biosynthesis monooxygenase family protein [Actinacidiphila oryziradicis]|uniref:Antibiotic biosynthesis monooxygenase n=1 Tax=Actinacidiphila oryziradicis TaxID=2571141 RepID=A0A4U0T8N8_9ACTN|nr:antibiotic biosynthesis monooxygenase family protein [Actinacidiphila oryziradicis]TKA11205.1 antibiotic biosynthesis monooxygenase [Actinacidiphila oryziradicis]